MMYVVVLDLDDDRIDYKVFRSENDARKRWDIAYRALAREEIIRTKVGGSVSIVRARLYVTNAIDAREAKVLADAGKAELLQDSKPGSDAADEMIAQLIDELQGKP